jgi:hypothetical protein
MSKDSTTYIPSDEIRRGKMLTSFCCTIWDHSSRPGVKVDQFRHLPHEAAAEIAYTLTSIVPEYCAAVDAENCEETGYFFNYRGCYEHGCLVREGEFSAVTLVRC